MAASVSVEDIACQVSVASLGLLEQVVMAVALVHSLMPLSVSVLPLMQ